MPAISTGLAIGLGVAGAVGGSAIGAIGASKAAGAQSRAAMSAAELQHQDQMAALAEQKRQFDLQQQNLAPWLKAGTQGIGTLSSLLSTPGEGLLTPWTEQFNAPTAEQARATPGYEFTLGQGEQAIQNAAAARGNLLSTGTLKALTGYAEGLADTTYGETYNRALGEYQQRYNIFQGNQTNTFNRLAALSGVGQTAANTLGTLGQQGAANVANINLTGGAQQGASLMNAGAARASGYAGIANALTGGIGSISQWLLLQNMLNPASGGGGIGVNGGYGGFGTAGTGTTNTWGTG